MLFLLFYFRLTLLKVTNSSLEISRKLYYTNWGLSLTLNPNIFLDNECRLLINSILVR